MKQKEALSILKTGENVFLTGAAGSGKTFLLNEYIDYLKENEVATAITASTGIAATHLGGRTVHSWCGMGIEDDLSPEKINALKKKNYLARSIAHNKVLIIDEISMLSARQLDLVNRICQMFKEDMRPFGGMQVVFCGDFFQLPPVGGRDKDVRFVADSSVWNGMDLKVCYLEEQHRQSDNKFMRILSEIREGNVTDEARGILSRRIGKPIRGAMRPTKLHTHNVDVETYNLKELDRLSGRERVFEMEGEGLEKLVENMKKGYCLAPQLLGLKTGAMVMFVKNNFGKGFVNGTLGRVKDFDDDSGFPLVETLSGDLIEASPEQWTIEDGREVIASVRQVPLRLAWAITVHKSQGMSLDAAEMDLRKTFEFGMGYVALSRVRSLSGMHLSGFNDMALRIRPEVIAFDRELKRRSEEDDREFKKAGKAKIKALQDKFIMKTGGERYSGGLFDR